MPKDQQVFPMPLHTLQSEQLLYQTPALLIKHEPQFSVFNLKPLNKYIWCTADQIKSHIYIKYAIWDRPHPLHHWIGLNLIYFMNGTWIWNLFSSYYLLVSRRGLFPTVQLLHLSFHLCCCMQSNSQLF